MSTLRLGVEITSVEPAGDLVYVEGRGESGVQLGLYLRAGLLAARAGQRVTLTIEAAEQAAPSLRERMQRAPPTEAARSSAATAASEPGEASKVMLAAIFGTPTGGETSERDVMDEMDALFGRRR
ncbi:MAG: hypothetical protein R3F65_32235 [bacterium]